MAADLRMLSFVRGRMPRRRRLRMRNCGRTQAAHSAADPIAPPRPLPMNHKLRDAGVRTLLVRLALAVLLSVVAVTGLALAAADRTLSSDGAVLSVLVGVASLGFGLGAVGALVLGRRLCTAVNALRAAADRLARGEPVDLRPLRVAEADQAVAALRRAYRRMHSCRHQRDEALQRSRLLAYEARHDPMTKLLNRPALERQLADRLQLNRSEGRPLTLFFIDIDDFKPVNDRHGHLVGDDLLRAFAARLRAGIRDGDCAARVGGDEFVVVFDSMTPAEALPVAEQLVERLSAPYSVRQLSLRVGACIGIAACPDHGCTAPALIKAADEAMYRAKSAGKNDFRVSGLSPL